MRQARTSFDHIIWAALPMAQTSQIEGRLTMILDKTRSRRTLTRRALIAAFALGAAVLVPLSILQPGAKAQNGLVSAQEATGEAHGIQLMGIANAALPGSNWWDKHGSALPAPPLGVNLIPSGMTTTAGSGEKALLIAFHLPASLQNKPLVYDVPGTMGLGVTVTSPRGTVTSRSLEFQMHNGVTAYEAAFPRTLAKTDVQIGVATGLGTETVNCPKRSGKTHFQRQSGEVVFNLVPSPRRLPAGQAAQSYALFVVSDHFRRPSPLKTSYISSLGGSLQVAQHDGQNYDRAVYALDSAGRVVTKFNVFSYTWPDETSKTGDYSSMKTQQIAHIPNSLLKRIASFRLVARPYQWVEFKDVALQPAQEADPASASARDTIPPQDYATPWTSQLTKSRWQPHTTFSLAVPIAPAVSGTRPDPPVTGQLVSGPGRATHFSINAWKPGRSNFLTVKFDYTPNVADKVHPDIIHLLTKAGKVAAVFTYYSV